MKNLISSLTAIAASSAALAHAQPSETAPSDAHARADRSHVSATVGLATPVGQLGAEFAFVPHRNLEIGVGFGVASLIHAGTRAEASPQGAIMPRYRFPVGPVRFTLGAGVSGGRYDTNNAKTTALWLNGEAGADYFLPNGLFVGGYLGYGKVIAHGDVTDSDSNTPVMSLDEDALPYLGLRFGYAF